MQRPTFRNEYDLLLGRHNLKIPFRSPIYKQRPQASTLNSTHIKAGKDSVFFTVLYDYFRRQSLNESVFRECQPWIDTISQVRLYLLFIAFVETSLHARNGQQDSY